MGQLPGKRKNNIPNNHNTAISYIRLVSMLMIILCHFLQYFNLELAWWLNVGVQVFFTMSGFLYGSKEIDRPIVFFVRRFRKILIPYWLILVIVSMVHILFAPGVFSWGKFISAMLCVGTVPGMEHLWFIPYILLCYLLLPYLLYLKTASAQFLDQQRLLVAVGIFTALQFVGFTFRGYGMIPNRVSCFLCGTFLAELRKKKTYFRRFGIMICGVALLFNIARIYGAYIIKLENNLIFDLFVRYAHGTLGVAIFMVLYGVFENTPYSETVNFSDRYSYFIYLSHQFYILGPLSMMKLMPSVAINSCLIVCCIVISGMLLEKLTTQANRIVDKFRNHTT